MSQGPCPADVHRAQAVIVRESVMNWRRPFKVVEHATFVDELVLSALENLRGDLEAIINGRCPHRPETRLGQPVGMYHCPECWCMVVAGVAVHPHDDGCRYGLNHDR